VIRQPCLVKPIPRTPTGQTPDLLALHRRYPDNYPFLLESVAHGPDQARYDILFAFPGDRLQLDGDDCLYWRGSPVTGQSFLDALNHCWHEAAEGAGCEHAELPFTGGWFVFLAYELVREIEPSLRNLKTSPAWPQAMAVRVPAAIIYDHDARQYSIVAETEALLNTVWSDAKAMSASTCAGFEVPECAAIHEDDPVLHGAQVDRIKRYIREGDVFQVNLSRLWRAMLTRSCNAADLYAALRRTNPAPFAGLARIDYHYEIVSSSPERLIKTSRGMAYTRPIAGTYPRGIDEKQDKLLMNELVSHPKERAEHVMLIDLERNDLGRICKPGTVEVSELMTVESYRHVHHIVSEVRGQLRPDIMPGEVIAATFPGGTITGCPKVRCMEIIAELEDGPRGAYTGSMGYINHNGDMDLNILIRTMVKQDDEIHFRAGSGIVADSDPVRELEETRHKARGMMRSLREEE